MKGGWASRHCFMSGFMSASKAPCFNPRDTGDAREIPPPAGENAGVRDDSFKKKISEPATTQFGSGDLLIPHGICLNSSGGFYEMHICRPLSMRLCDASA